MTQPDTKRLVTEARFTAISNAATAAAQSQIDASASSAAASATAAQAALASILVQTTIDGGAPSSTFDANPIDGGTP